jgi:lipid II:glycine glycyltransferase (peptidoglycan interpeptide bridge formation enzyme)
MDLSAPLPDLREGMKAHWKRELKVAEKGALEIVEGSGDELFDSFIEIYKEMVSRKNFVEPNDIFQFRKIQAQLPDRLKMKVMLCKSGEQVYSGVICSACGNSAVYLFGATSTAGMKSRGSYLLQWRMLERLKQSGVTMYNLNGINPEKNPGTYKFKSDLAGSHGQEVSYLGRFDCSAGMLSSLCIEAGDRFRATVRSLRSALRNPSALESR